MAFARTPNKRANTVRPYGRDKDFLFGLHTEVHFIIVATLDRRGRRSLQSKRVKDEGKDINRRFRL